MKNIPLLTLLIFCFSFSFLFAQKNNKEQRGKSLMRPWVYDTSNNSVTVFDLAGTKRITAYYDAKGQILPFHTEQWSEEGRPEIIVIRDARKRATHNIEYYADLTKATDIDPETNKVIREVTSWKDGTREEISFGQENQVDSVITFFPDKRIAHRAIRFMYDTVLLRPNPRKKRRKMIKVDTSYLAYRYINSWNMEAEQECKDGNGIITDYYFISDDSTGHKKAVPRWTRRVKAGQLDGPFSCFDSRGKLAFSSSYDHGFLSDTLWIHNRETGEKEKAIDFDSPEDWRLFAEQYESDFPRLAELFYREPEPINMFEVRRTIGYPEDAIMANIEGEYHIRVLVNEQGKVVTYYPVKFAHPVLMEAVDRQLTKLRFKGRNDRFTAKMFWIINISFAFRLLN